MIIERLIADKARKEFIKGATRTDKMRLEMEQLPRDCDTECDILYADTDIPENKLDIYTRRGIEVGDEAFFLVHGGAFVYGSKELDKCFGMTLAVFSGMPVVNVNYHHMPEKTLIGVANDLCTAIDFLARDRGIRKVHLVGDSAGGYLVVLLACLLRSDAVRKDMNITIESDTEALSLASICGIYEGERNSFPSIYFERPFGKEEGEAELPSYIYDTKEIIRRTGFPRTCLITGDKDFLHDVNVKMRDFLEGEGIPVKFFDAISSETKLATHVFAISDPGWQESHTALNLIIENARG